MGFPGSGPPSHAGPPNCGIDEVEVGEVAGDEVEVTVELADKHCKTTTFRVIFLDSDGDELADHEWDGDRDTTLDFGALTVPEDASQIRAEATFAPGKSPARTLDQASADLAYTCAIIEDVSATDVIGDQTTVTLQLAAESCATVTYGVDLAEDGEVTTQGDGSTSLAFDVTVESATEVVGFSRAPDGERSTDAVALDLACADLTSLGLSAVVGDLVDIGLALANDGCTSVQYGVRFTDSEGHVGDLHLEDGEVTNELTFEDVEVPQGATGAHGVSYHGGNVLETTDTVDLDYACGQLLADDVSGSAHATWHGVPDERAEQVSLTLFLAAERCSILEHGALFFDEDGDVTGGAWTLDTTGNPPETQARTGALDIPSDAECLRAAVRVPGGSVLDQTDTCVQIRKMLPDGTSPRMSNFR